MERDSVVARLRGEIRDALFSAEDEAGLEVTFRQCPPNATHRANYVYDPLSQSAFVSLGRGWRDYDVAHELEHLRMQLVEGFGILAWRRVEPTPEVDAACTRIMSYVQDEVVWTRLLAKGHVFDGEVVDGQLFALYREVASRLRKGAARRDDGMAHLDALGRGVICRAAHLVQAVLLAARRNAITPERAKDVERFIKALRRKRKEETRYAGEVLALFAANDVLTVAGHDAILKSWASLEGLDAHVGLSHYVQTAPGYYVLPWP